MLLVIVNDINFTNLMSTIIVSINNIITGTPDAVVNFLYIILSSYDIIVSSACFLSNRFEIVFN